MTSLGVDPGEHGGLALVRPALRCVDRWWAITPVAAGYRLRAWSGSESIHASMHDIGAKVAADLALAVLALGELRPRWVVEGQFGKGPSVIKLAQNCGELMGPLRSVCVGEPLRPLANERRRGREGWRARVLHLPNSLSAERAEDAAVRMTSAWSWAGAHSPHDLYRGGMLLEAELGAVCEAAAIACWTSKGSPGAPT